MRKIVQKMVTVLIVFGMGAGLLAGCGSSASNKEDTLYVYNWSEYIPQEVYEEFEKETGIHVVESTFSSNEEMLAKLVAGGTGEYDVIVASNYVIPAMIEQDLIQKMDTSKLENFGNLTDTSVGMNFDPKNEYSVPYMATITLLGINEKKCQELNVEINKLDDLLNPALENNLVVPDDCREVVDAALKAIGEDPDTKDEAVVNRTEEWLSKLAPNVKLYDSDTPYAALQTNEVAAGLVYNMDLAKAMWENKDLKLVDIPEGNEIAYDNFVLTSKTEKQDMAMKFIDYILRPEVYKKCLDEYPCVCLNKEALKIMDAKYTDNPAANVSEEILKKAHVTGDVGEAATYYDNVFSKMKN
ncbi:MAG: spermidine/putrescine ABC transporter substrate-binding protein [Lachnospiraceae bacterium]|jgi:spermidine/putrescine-binding protein|nr:spermidine/putrescine ABC transporter substrate-binding protein [Lachnospiraceae bacterium]